MDYSPRASAPLRTEELWEQGGHDYTHTHTHTHTHTVDVYGVVGKTIQKYTKVTIHRSMLRRINSEYTRVKRLKGRYIAVRTNPRQRPVPMDLASIIHREPGILLTVIQYLIPT